KELGAITMKALAKAQKDRYQTVEALISDIDHYREGRAVSAKEDAPWETLVKLVRRNRAVSATIGAAAAALVAVVSISFSVNLHERTKAEEALAEVRKAQRARSELMAKDAPLCLGSARNLIRNSDFA